MPNTNPIGADALRAALTVAQAGLEFAAARLPAQEGDFVPIHLAALKIVNAALASPTTQAAPAAVAYRVLRKRHDGEWVKDGRGWCDGMPAHDLIGDIALRSERWKIEYAYAAAPTDAPHWRDALRPLNEGQIWDWWRSETGLEDCDLCKFEDFAKVVRAVEARVARGGGTEAGR